VKSYLLLSIGTAVVSLAVTSLAASTGPVFYGDAPDDHHPWAVHDRNRPQPKLVTPGTFSSQEQPGKPPSDATILFDGTDLSKWLNSKDAPAEWLVKDGHMEVKPGTGEIHTKAQFGDLQLHIEWAAPTEIKGDSQGRGNSGVFLPGGVEIQVLDCYNNPSYADGMAGGYYGVNPPMANAVRPPGQYQAYDIVFRKPVYRDGKVLDPGYVTVFVNGVLTQDHTPLEGSTGHMGRTKPGPFPERASLRLQDHGNPMRFRNIWCRELPPRTVEGGTDGYLTTEATMAKRREIATTIRADAAKLKNPAQPMPELLRLAESLIYETDPAALKQTEQMAAQYVASLKALPANQLAAKRDEARGLRDALNYLARWKDIPADFAPKVALDQLFKDQNWDKKR
jgi:hypothetical protein